ncbi:MAG: 2-C-methyl-D-erythritol 4-phosphate cytidylyltransferase [Burkholderiaceae bacterium]|nr:2-C-methyl-D-erythritol 4-phosphate cytidylyltransferase [Burkholderiaceae bacterium]
MDTSPRFHAVVPAAGIGARVGAATPKQYLELAGQSLLQWSVQALLAAAFIDEVCVVVAAGDTLAATQVGHWPRVRVLPVGGATRRDTVLAGLQAAGSDWHELDWVLVHDAARPGLSLASLLRLHDALAADPLGGLLALPVSDTVKQVQGAQAVVARTLSRDDLWLAQTPQMFRYGPLRAALRAYPDVTDEAGAIEAAGGRPRLVTGERHNFKVTTRDDLHLMGAWLATRSQDRGGVGNRPPVPSEDS